MNLRLLLRHLVCASHPKPHMTAGDTEDWAVWSRVTTIFRERRKGSSWGSHQSKVAHDHAGLRVCKEAPHKEERRSGGLCSCWSGRCCWRTRQHDKGCEDIQKNHAIKKAKLGILSISQGKKKIMMTVFSKPDCAVYVSKVFGITRWAFNTLFKSNMKNNLVITWTTRRKKVAHEKTVFWHI